MKRSAWILALLLGAGPTTGAWAADPAPALPLGDLAATAAGTEDGFSPEALAAILGPPAGGTTRSLQAGGEPGTTGSGVVPDLKIQFATNSAAISPQAERNLGALAMALQFPRMQDVRLIIAGHTDTRGSAEANKLLSQRRAEAVVAWLVEERSIAPNRLQAIGYGEERLADPRAPASGVNRRVEVIAKHAGASDKVAAY